MQPALGEVEKLALLSRAGTPKAPSRPKQAAPYRSLRRRLSPPAINELVARYTAGEKTPALSREFGISESGLRDLLRAEGVTLRGHKITATDAQQAVRLYASGLTIDQVASQVGYAWGTIRKVLLQNGVTLRNKFGPEHGECSGKDG